MSMDGSSSSQVNEHRLSARTTIVADTWTNIERYMRKFLRNPMLLSATLFQPIVWLVLFSQVFQPIAEIPDFGIDSYLEFFLPAIIIMVALIAGATAGLGFVEDFNSGMFEKMLVSPMNRTSIFLGKTLADAIQIIIQVAIALVVGIVLGARIEAGITGVFGLLIVGLVFSLWFIGFSTIVAVYTQNSEATMAIGNILALPLVFMSDAFLPAHFLPEWIQLVSVLNPVSYGIDAARTIIIEGWVWETILPALGVLIALDVVVGAIAIWTLDQAVSSKP